MLCSMAYIKLKTFFLIIREVFSALPLFFMVLHDSCPEVMSFEFVADNVARVASRLHLRLIWKNQIPTINHW